MVKTQNISIFSFFSGAGFLDLGFEKTGFDVCYVNEIHKPFLEAYAHSRSVMQMMLPKYGYSNGSIEDLVGDEKLVDAIEMERKDGNICGFIGGPPCPDFSIGGKNKGRNGENGKLSETYANLVCNRKPEFFLFENVKGLYRTRKHRKFFEHLKRKLERFYHLNERLVNSIEYGVPQDRDRIILIGFRRDCFPAIPLDWGQFAYPNRTAFEFSWPGIENFAPERERPIPNHLPLELTVQHWFDKNNVENHPNAHHSFTPRAGKAKFEVIGEGDDKKKSYKRLHRWRYSPTAAYGNNEVHLHPYKARRLSAAEALSIQSLPAKFELPDTMTLTNMFKCIGNGVPFLAAKGFASAIHSHTKEHHESYSEQLSRRNQSTAA